MCPPGFAVYINLGHRTAMPKTIAIIGNGFDLNLGMRTSYRDFLVSPFFPKSDDESSLAAHLRRKYDAERWVDIEQELAIYSYSNSNRSTVQHEYQELRSALAAYVRSLLLPKADGETHAHNLIRTLAGKGEMLMVNFNYTQTVQHLLASVMGEQGMADIEHWSLHGTCEDGRIIFGVDDAAKISSNHSFLKKSFAENFFARGLVQKLLSASEVHFFGHSLGSPDHMYFRNYFRHLASSYSQCTLYLYHHGDQGRLDLLYQVSVMSNSQVAAVRSNVDFRLVDVST